MLSQWQCLTEEASEARRRQGPGANDWGLRFGPTKWETFLTISTSLQCWLLHMHPISTERGLTPQDRAVHISVSPWRAVCYAAGIISPKLRRLLDHRHPHCDSSETTARSLRA